MERYDVIVIGQGYSGLTAASLAAKRGLRTANFESELFGGLIVNVNELDPVPAGAEHSGVELASTLAMENMDLGVVGVSESVVAVERGDNGMWVVKSDAASYAARHVIVASGARFRKLGIPGEDDFVGQGVSNCADCDGPMFSGKEAVIVGGGDSAFQEALALATYASKVTIVMRGAAPKARADLCERVAAHPKLVQLCNAEPTAIIGSPGQGVEGLRVAVAGAAEQTIACAGVFVFAGLEPNTAFLAADVARDAAGQIVTSEQCATAQHGLWAIGAVRSGYGGMLTDAAADASRVVGALS